MNNKDNVLTLYTEDGKEVECEILFTHHSDDFNKDYVVFVTRDTNEASAASYVQNEHSEGGHLDRIETEEEWKMLEDLLEKFLNEEHNCSCCDSGCDSCSECDGECDGKDDCCCE